MKKLLSMMVALLSLIAATALISCGNDDEPSSGNSSIVGTWETSGGSSTVYFGSDRSYRSDDYFGSVHQYRVGTYSYNPSQALLVIDIQAISGNNGAYTDTYLVQTLNSTTLVLVDLDGGSTLRYTRK